MNRILATQLISGLLAIFPDQVSEHLVLLHDQGLPVVIIDDQGVQKTLPWVGTDNRYGAYLATQHLLRLGHRRIGHIRGLYLCSEERYQGYCDALREAGLVPDPALVWQGNFDAASGQACARALFALPERPTAVFAASDQMAYGVLTVAEQQGIRIPQDVAVVGFDDLPISAYVRPPLTAVRQPFYEMGRCAASLLLSLVDPQYPFAYDSQPDPRVAPPRSGKPIRFQLPSSLTVRESCGARSSYHLAIPGLES